MARLRARGRRKKAELEARKAAAHTRQAAEDTGQAVRDLAKALVEQMRTMKLDERAGDLAERVRDSETVGRAAAKRDELTARARRAYHDSRLDDRFDELSARARQSDAYQSARSGASRASAGALSGLGTWLASGPRGERLGVQERKRSRGWLAMLLGIGVGYAVAVFTTPKSGAQMREALTGRSSSDPVVPGSSTSNIGLTPSEKPLADKVRTRLGEDPRTSDLPKLNINVAEGTVFVRGAIPDDADQESIRSVIISVPGVEDVDLQVTRV